MSQGEHFLELVEHQHRRDRLIVGRPVAGAPPMEMLPQRAREVRGRRLEAGRLGGPRDVRHDLLAKRRGVLVVREADVHRQALLIAQLGEETSPEQRALTQTG